MVKELVSTHLTPKRCLQTDFGFTAGRIELIACIVRVQFVSFILILKKWCNYLDTVDLFPKSYSRS